MTEIVSEKELQRRAKMREILKNGNLWWKVGEKVVMTENSDNDSIATIDFVHSDDMISIVFDDTDEFALVFDEQIRKPNHIELSNNKRMWRYDPPIFHYTYGHAEHDD